MDLKLQEHSLRELPEAINAQQEGRQPNFFLEEADLLTAECYILMRGFRKNIAMCILGLVITTLLVMRFSNMQLAINSSLAGNTVTRSAVTSPAATIPVIIGSAATAPTIRKIRPIE